MLNVSCLEIGDIGAKTNDIILADLVESWMDLKKRLDRREQIIATKYVRVRYNFQQRSQHKYSIKG